MPTFLDLGVPAPLATVLAREGKTEAFPIQRDTLPDSLAGRDVLGMALTLLNERADEVVAQLYGDYCRSAGVR